MEVEFIVKVNGREVSKRCEQVQGTLEQMEEHIYVASRCMGAEALQFSVVAVEAPRPVLSSSGGKLRHRGYQERTLVGLHGPVTIRRARYQCSKTKRMVFPLDTLLDIPTGAVTCSLARRALHLGTHMSFAELQEELRIQHEVRLTDTTLDNLMQKAGGVAVADQQAELARLVATPRGVARQKWIPVKLAAPSRMYVSCDGIFYRTRLREADPDHRGQKRLIYQEMKVGTVFWQDSQNRWHKRALAGRESPEHFGLRLWKLAVECGLLTCSEVIFISDGGSWCQTVADGYFQEARRILDWYHLSEHVWKAARALYPHSEQEAKRWVEASLDYLHDHSGIGLLHHLERCLAARSEADGPALTALMNYLRPRLTITDYVAYRAKGYVIGSGMMESTCKQVVTQRLKGTGMQWSEPGALAMVHLVVHRLNGTWENFWTGRPLQRAA